MADFSIEPIAGDASARKYHRIRFAPKDTATLSSMILCEDLPVPDFEGSDFLRINRFLTRHGYPVPAVIGIEATIGWMLLEDGGSHDLSSLLNDPQIRREQQRKLLLEALENILALHRLPLISPVQNRFFDFHKLRWEMDFMLENTIRAFPDRFTHQSLTHLSNYLDHQCRIAASAPEQFVFVHRDYHSRNIMLRDHDQQQLVIDYQDARMGTPWYDVVSLLYDPYLNIAASLRSELVEWLLQRSPLLNETHAQYPAILQQRLLKALGSYIYLTYGKQKDKYYSSIFSVRAIINSIQRELSVPEFVTAFLEQVCDAAILRGTR